MYESHQHHVEPQEAGAEENMQYDSHFTTTIKAVLPYAVRNLEGVDGKSDDGVLAIFCLLEFWLHGRIRSVEKFIKLTRLLCLYHTSGF